MRTEKHCLNRPRQYLEVSWLEPPSPSAWTQSNAAPSASDPPPKEGLAMATTMTKLHNRIRALMPQARSDLAALVACQSVADPRQFPESETLRAAQLVIDDFAAAGMRDT